MIRILATMRMGTGHGEAVRTEVGATVLSALVQAAETALTAALTAISVPHARQPASLAAHGVASLVAALEAVILLVAVAALAVVIRAEAILVVAASVADVDLSFAEYPIKETKQVIFQYL